MSVKIVSRLLVGWFLCLCLTACVNGSKITRPFSEIEAFSLCQNTPQGIAMTNKIEQEYGFKEFTEGAYHPVMAQQLLGRTIRIVEIAPQGHKTYIEGRSPDDIAESLRGLLPHTNCSAYFCQASLADNQIVFVYKAEIKKAKNTIVVECTKAVNSVQ